MPTKIIKQIDPKTRLVQDGKIPDVHISLQRKKWWGWKTINSVRTYYNYSLAEYEKLLLDDEKRRKEPYYGRIVSTEQF